jgi:hypothetical protein
MRCADRCWCRDGCRAKAAALGRVHGAQRRGRQARDSQQAGAQLKVSDAPRGDVAALPPRKLLRVVLGRKDRIALFGGPGFVAQVEHKLRAYAWNVVHRHAVELVLDVREIGMDGRGSRARFSSRNGFARESGAVFDCEGDQLHDEPPFRERGRFVDHDARSASGHDAHLAVGPVSEPAIDLADARHTLLELAPGHQRALAMRLHRNHRPAASRVRVCSVGNRWRHCALTWRAHVDSGQIAMNSCRYSPASRRAWCCRHSLSTDRAVPSP